MNLAIEPNVGVGDLRLGMTPEQIRSAVKSPFRSFKKTPKSIFPTDAFDDIDIHAYYKAPGICNAIEMFSNSQPTLKGRKIIGESFVDISKWLQLLDENLESDDSGLTSKKLGIGLYVPDILKSELPTIESVIVFEKGYYG